MLVGGGAALWANEKHDAQGYISTDGHRLSTASTALASENMDIDADGINWLFDDAIGEVKVGAKTAGDQPVFVGIARTADARAYLHGVDRTTVTDAGWGMFDGDPEYRDEPGARRATPPGRETFWVASAQGPGEQALTWDMKDGDWTLVVMNADGSPRVDVDLATGARAPWLNEAGWGLLAGALLLSIGAAALLRAGRSGPRDPAALAETATAGPLAV